MNHEAELEAGSPGGVKTLEAAMPLSQSKLWQLQRQYFQSQGVEAWRRGTVPHFVTSNRFAARAGARLVLGLLRDLADDLSRREPIYIVELGAGSGRFGYHFLNAFTDLLDRSSLAGSPFCYVLSDFHDTTLESWRQNSQLQPFVDRGVLDWAVFDAEHDTAMTLENRGLEVRAETLNQPLVVFAHYVFDGLPHDLFRVDRGQVEECRASLQLEIDDAPGEAVGDQRGSLDQLRLEYECHEIDGPYYREPVLEALLSEYSRVLDNGYVSIPVAAIDCLRRLKTLAGQGLLLVSADRGYSRPQVLNHRGVPYMARHGSVSFPVNYHALGRYAESLGGVALHPQRSEWLSVNALILGLAGRELRETRLAFDDAISNFGPDVYFVLKKRLEQDLPSMEWRDLLAFLQLSDWDVRVFSQCAPRLRELLEQGSLEVDQEAEVREVIERVWAGYFFFGEDYDLAFELGLILQYLGSYPQALSYFEQSLERHGDHTAVYFNKGMSYRGMWQRERAIQCFRRALELDPDNEEARAVMLRLLAALRVDDEEDGG